MAGAATLSLLCENENSPPDPPGSLADARSASKGEIQVSHTLAHFGQETG